MKKREIMAFWQGLNAVSGQGDQHRRFAYGIARNIGKLRGVIMAMEEAAKMLEEFEEQRLELAQEMAKKDEDGNPQSLPGGQGVVIGNMIAFNKRLAEIRKETGQDKKDEEIEEMMEADEEVDIYMVPFKLLPEKIGPHMLEAIMPMIEEPTDEDFEDDKD